MPQQNKHVIYVYEPLPCAPHYVMLFFSLPLLVVVVACLPAFPLVSFTSWFFKKAQVAHNLNTCVHIKFQIGYRAIRSYRSFAPFIIICIALLRTSPDAFSNATKKKITKLNRPYGKTHFIVRHPTYRSKWIYSRIPVTGECNAYFIYIWCGE